MKPDIVPVLKDLEARLVGVISPEIQPAYHGGTIAFVGFMLGILADEWDRSADRLVEENRAIRAIFAAASPGTADPVLLDRLRALAQVVEPNVRVSTLKAANDALRAALIDLHVAVERTDSEEARRIDTMIRRELVASTERRALSTANF